MQIDRQSASVPIGGEDNLFDQLPDELRRFVAMLWIIEADQKPLHFLLVAQRHVGMDVERSFALVFDRGLQHQLALLKAVDLVSDQNRIDPIFDGLDQLGDCALSLFKFRATNIQRGIVLHAHLVEVLGVFLAKRLCQLRVHELAAQRPQDDVLQPLFADGQIVRARPFVPACRTSVMRGRNHREAATAAAAPQQERQQALGATLFSVCGLRVQLPLMPLHGLPKLIADDAQMRHFSANPLGFVIEPTIFTPGIGVFEEALLPPNLHTDIQLVVQNTGAAPTIAVNRARCPRAAALRRHTLSIQFGRNFLWRLTFDVIFEDTTHDLGLMRVDLAFARNAVALGVIARLDVIAVAFAARAFAVDRPLLLSAMYAA